MNVPPLAFAHIIYSMTEHGRVDTKSPIGNELRIMIAASAYSFSSSIQPCVSEHQSNNVIQININKKFCVCVQCAYHVDEVENWSGRPLFASRTNTQTRYRNLSIECFQHVRVANQLVSVQEMHNNWPFICVRKEIFYFIGSQNEKINICACIKRFEEFHIPQPSSFLRFRLFFKLVKLVKCSGKNEITMLSITYEIYIDYNKWQKARRWQSSKSSNQYGWNGPIENARFQ